MRRNRFYLLFYVWVLCLSSLPCCGANADPLIVQPISSVDQNGNRIIDSLETSWSEASRYGLIVSFDHPPTQNDLLAIQSFGYTIDQVWHHLLYAVSLKKSSGDGSTLNHLVSIPGVVLIGPNLVGRACLYQSTRQTGARAAWSMSPGYEGDPSYSIAILDTGIDATHPDFDSRVVDWHDFVGTSIDTEDDLYQSPTDKNGHGTHLAGIAAGSGASAGMATGTGYLEISVPRFFEDFAYAGVRHGFPVDTTGEIQPINFKLKWKNSNPGYNVSLSLFDETSSYVSYKTFISNSSQPASYSYLIPQPVLGYYSTNVVYSRSNENSPYWLQIRTPMSSLGDHMNLMKGVASGCTLTGLKVMDDNGLGTVSNLLNALEWISANLYDHNIVVANLGLNFGSISPELDTAINNLVSQGVVCVCPAGNTGGTSDPAVASPGSASDCMAVGAIDSLDRIAGYSSTGAANAKKPDLLAPGGNLSPQEHQIIAPDSNQSDRNLNLSKNIAVEYPDAYPNDYAAYYGTSMASAHVAGAVGLLAQAMGGWNFTREQALQVKSVLLMTATETDGSNPDRGERDSSEGYGRLNIPAAIEAITKKMLPGETLHEQFGAGPFSRKCFARRVYLAKGIPYHFALSVPAGADFDLYLYSGIFTNSSVSSNDSSGDPMICAKSVFTSLGKSETIDFIPQESGNYYLVAKWVLGQGEMILNFNCETASYETSGEIIRFGWNLVSVPATPVDPDPLVVFSPLDCAVSSFQFWKSDDEGGGFQSYGTHAGWTGPITAGTPYWFLHTKSPFDLRYTGYPITQSMTRSFKAVKSSPHWVMFGSMQNRLIPCQEILISSTSYPTPMSWEEAYKQKIIEAKALGFSNGTGTFFSAGSSFSAPDKDFIEPWVGYWILLNTNESVTITFPK